MPEKRVRLPPMFRLLYQALLWTAYQVLLWLSLPAVLFRLEWRARREPEYGKRIGERMGRVPERIPPGCIWFHAVSAGETIAVAPLIAELASEFSEVLNPATGAHALGEKGSAAKYGGLPFLVTAMTPTGSAQVTSRLGGAVHHCYAPYDFPFAVRSFFDRVRPRLLVLVETELWPNLIDEAHRRGVPVLLVNARLSERSARGYRFVRGLTRRMLRQVGFVACQYGDHLERFKALGLRNGQGAAFGSVKFDATLPEDHAGRVSALRQELGLRQSRVWVAGSTHPGEDELVLEAHARVRARHPESCLLLVPRHPVRGREVSGLAQNQGFEVRRLGSTTPVQTDAPADHVSASDQPADSTARTLSDQPSDLTTPTLSDQPAGPTRPTLSDQPADPTGPFQSDMPAGSSEPLLAALPADPPQQAQVIVCDTMGQLRYLYGLSDVAFLGGSLVPVGGHNPIEAALCRQPLVTGPHTFNFDEVVAAFAAAQCLTRVRTAAQLADAVIAAFEDDGARHAAGARALQVVEKNRGATARLLNLLRTRIRAAIA